LAVLIAWKRRRGRCRAGSLPNTQPPMPPPGLSGCGHPELVGTFFKSATMMRPKLSTLS
jgi:hypothetical protein